MHDFSAFMVYFCLDGSSQLLLAACTAEIFFFLFTVPKSHSPNFADPCRNFHQT